MNVETYFKITYGLYVVSSVNNGKYNGFVSNTVFQVTAEPPQFAITCSKNNYTAEMINASKVLSISILEKETKYETMGTFGYKSGKDIDKFAKANYKIGKTGAPILLDDAIAWFECKVLSTTDLGTHLLYICSIVDDDILDASKEPLTYAYYRDAKKGKAPKNAPTYISEEKMKPVAQEKIDDVYYCPACGYEYDPAVGDPDSGIAAGTKFEDIPDNWVCPLCGTSKADFEKR